MCCCTCPVLNNNQSRDLIMPDDTIIPYTFKGQDLTGKRFNRLIVLGFVGRTMGPTNLRYWYKCKCDCGVIKIIEAFKIKYGGSQSCGCLRDKQLITHGGAVGKIHDLIYSVWRHMRERCLSKSSKSYGRYGGRGITIDPRWMKYENFRSDMASSYKPGLTINRKDNDGPYSKENCVWSTHVEQARNTRASRWIEFNGQKRVMAEWDEILGYPKGTTSHRISYGWSIEKTLTTPIMGSNGKSNTWTSKIARES